MTSMNAQTGHPITGLDEIIQSIRDILTTPKGSRVMRRDYGSIIHKLIDRPLNAATRLLMSAAAAMAIARWEKRFKLTRAAVSAGDASGKATITLTGYRTDVPQPALVSFPISV